MSSVYKVIDKAERKALRYLFGNDTKKTFLFFELNGTEGDEESYKRYLTQLEQFKALYNSNDKELKTACWNALFNLDKKHLVREDFSDDEWSFIEEFIRLDHSMISANCFNCNTSFASSRLILRPTNESSPTERELYAKHLKNDGDFFMYTGQKSTEKNIKNFLDIYRPYFFSVYEKGSKKMVGLVGLYGYDEERRLATAQWYIFKPYRNKGYATEAVTALARRAFEGKLVQFKETCWKNKLKKHHARIDLIRVQIRKSNIASQRTAESCGFRFEHILHRYFIIEGQGVEDAMVYELTPETLIKE